jgi:hypothetical protein
MGLLRLGARRAIQIDDRLLAHLEPIIVGKLARGDAFPLVLENGQGSETFWITEQATLFFEFDETAPIQLNEAWLAELAAAADSPGGLWPTPEP